MSINIETNKNTGKRQINNITATILSKIITQLIERNEIYYLVELTKMPESISIYDKYRGWNSIYNERGGNILDLTYNNNRPLYILNLY